MAGGGCYRGASGRSPVARDRSIARNGLLVYGCGRYDRPEVDMGGGLLALICSIRPVIGRVGPFLSKSWTKYH